MGIFEYLRQFRIAEYAVFDFAISFLIIYLLSPVLSKACRKIKIDIPKLNWLYLTLPISILTHLAVGVMTPMTQNFFDRDGHYILKIIIVALIVLGVKDIKIIKKVKNLRK